MSVCANTQNFKTKSSTRANSTIFLLVTLTWAQFHMKLMGFFFLSQACRIKPAGSQQTTTELVRSLLSQDTLTDPFGGQGFFFFLACAGSVSYQKIKKDGAFSDSRWQTRPMPQWFFFLKMEIELHIYCVWLLPSFEKLETPRNFLKWLSSRK